MASSIRGFGTSPLGVSRFYFGSPATADAPGVAPIGEGRYIDPETRDYAIDTTTPAADGNLRRWNRVDQLVYLALGTLRGTSVLADLGMASVGDRITPSLAQDARVAVDRALAHLTRAKLVKVVSVDIGVDAQHRAQLRLRWHDLTADIERPLERITVL